MLIRIQEIFNRASRELHKNSKRVPSEFLCEFHASIELQESLKIQESFNRALRELKEHLESFMRVSTELISVESVPF